MENPNNQDKPDIEIETEDIEPTDNLSLNEEIANVEFRIQELEILIDKKEQEYFVNESEEIFNEYQELKNEYKTLLKQRKTLLKNNAKTDQSVLEQVSLWVVIYGVLSVIISLPILTGQLWLGVASKIVSLIVDANMGLSSEDFLYKLLIFLIVFAFPLLLNLVTWLLHNNLLKKKSDKKVFNIFWIIQGVMSIGMIIYMSIQLYS